MEQTVIKVYSYNFEKPELSEETLEHFGVKGMHWGIRKDRKSQGSGGSRKKSSKAKKTRTRRQKRKAREEEIKNKSKEDIIKSRDLEAMSKRRNEFSNNEINEVLNRIGTEQRLDQMVKQQNPTTKDKIKKIVSSKEFKVVAGVTCLALPLVIRGAKAASYDRKNRYLTDSLLRTTAVNGNNPYTISKKEMKEASAALVNLLFGVQKPKW